jgi:hypothetical protein
VVTVDPLPLHSQTRVSGREKYQVRGGTKLVILDDRGNDLFYHSDESKGRVEVAIVIPADWDQRPGHKSEFTF